MERQTIVGELKNIIGDYLESIGLNFVDFIYRYEGKSLILRILVDRPNGGITLDDCAQLNNEIGRILDDKDILQLRYALEVFSPGLDRPLVAQRDFLRCLNKKAIFFLNEAINGKIELQGLINKVSDNAVYIDVGNEIIEVSLLKITKAKQVIGNI